jgi:hypothetical protein
VALLKVRDREVGKVKIPDRPARAAIALQGRIDPNPEKGKLVTEGQPILGLQMP